MVTERGSWAPDWTEAEQASWLRDFDEGKPVELPTAEHDEGECQWCDAIRVLMRRALDS